MKKIRIAIVSDTHDNWQVAAESIKENIKAEGAIDCLVMLGDYAGDGRQLERALQVPAYIVRGNCDGFSNEAEEQVFELGGWRFFICHGHRYQVKSTYQPVYYRGLELAADFVLFGHTHQAMYEEWDVTLINPGSVSSLNLRFDSASWGLLTLSEKKSENFFRKYEKKACQNI